MSSFRHLFFHLQKYGTKNRPLYVFATMILFWCIFEGIISYLIPIWITQNGISDTLMGVIVGSSSVAGALFDFVMCRILKSTFYRRVLLLMFSFSLLFSLILFQAHTFTLFLLMAVLWGIAFDLANYGNFNFVSHTSEKQEFTDHFGVIQVFKSLGYLLAPILAAAAIGEVVDWQPFALAWLFLGLGVVMLIILLFLTRKVKEEIPQAKQRVNLWREFHIWKHIVKILLPVLILTFTLNLFDSAFWTIGPLISQSFNQSFHGLFMVAYLLPVLLVGWFVGSLTTKLGKKRTAFGALFLGSLIMSFLYFAQSSIFSAILVFAGSFFLAFAWPSINSAYADYMEETIQYEQEIEGIEDFFVNIGYFVGPILAGFLADLVGIQSAFALFGVLGTFIAIILFTTTPKKIRVKSV